VIAAPLARWVFSCKRASGQAANVSKIEVINLKFVNLLKTLIKPTAILILENAARVKLFAENRF